MDEHSDFVKLRLLSLIGFSAYCFTLHRIFRREKAKAGLPEEITEEILSRLPLNSLIRFRIACKKCYSVISNDDFFAKLHLNHSKNLTFFETPDSIIQFTDIETFGSSRKIVFPDGISDARILGSANGLICLVTISDKLCFIWNPYTGCSKRLAIPTIGDNLRGFAYDSVSDDYKIVGEWDSKFRVFSLKSNSWRIREKGFSRILISWPVFTNGAIHWFFGGKTSPAFDIVDEKFFEIEMPESIKGYLSNYSPLFEYQDSLCVFNCTSPMMTTVWMMKEYRKTESWYKLFTVAAPERGTPNCIPRFGEVVFREIFLRLVKYNSKGKMCEVDKMYRFECVRVFTHKESLIWPECLKKRVACVEESNSIVEPMQCDKK